MSNATSTAVQDLSDSLTGQFEHRPKMGLANPAIDRTVQLIYSHYRSVPRMCALLLHLKNMGFIDNAADVRTVKAQKLAPKDRRNPALDKNCFLKTDASSLARMDSNQPEFCTVEILDEGDWVSIAGFLSQPDVEFKHNLMGGVSAEAAMLPQRMDIRVQSREEAAYKRCFEQMLSILFEPNVSYYHAVLSASRYMYKELQAVHNQMPLNAPNSLKETVATHRAVLQDSIDGLNRATGWALKQFFNSPQTSEYIMENKHKRIELKFGRRPYEGKTAPHFQDQDAAAAFLRNFTASSHNTDTLRRLMGEVSNLHFVSEAVLINSAAKALAVGQVWVKVLPNQYQAFPGDDVAPTTHYNRWAWPPANADEPEAIFSQVNCLQQCAKSGTPFADT